MINAFLAYYKNFTLDNPTITLTAVLWAMYVGFVFAVCASVYTRSYVGRLPRALLKGGHHAKDSAVGAEELNIKLSFGMRRALTEGKTLRKFVHIANIDECRTEVKTSAPVGALRRFFGVGVKYKYNFEKALFYIPEDKKYTADVRYENKGRRGSGALAVVAAVVLGGAAVAALMYFIPEILKLIDDAITLIKYYFAKE